MITLDALETADRGSLLAAWSEIYSAAPPKGMSQNHLRRFLAFEIQVRRTAGLSKAVQSALAVPESTASAPKVVTPGLKPGGRLLREWNGVTHVVDVTESGFLWRDKSWRSLSAIAREITGAHWSGPRFFGLTKKANR